MIVADFDSLSRQSVRGRCEPHQDNPLAAESSRLSTFVQFPKSVSLADTSAAVIALTAVLCGMAGSVPTRAVSAPVKHLAHLARVSDGHVRRTLTAWASDNAAPVGVVRISQRSKLYSINHDPKRFIAFPPQAIGKVSPVALTLLLELCRRLPYGDREGSIIATYTSIQGALNIDRNDITSRIKELESAGLLKVSRTVGPDGIANPNRYWVTGWSDQDLRPKPFESRTSPTSESRTSPTSESRTSPTVVETVQTFKYAANNLPPNARVYAPSALSGGEDSKKQQQSNYSRATNLIEALTWRTMWGQTIAIADEPTVAQLKRIATELERFSGRSTVDIAQDLEADTADNPLTAVKNPYGLLRHRLRELADNPQPTPQQRPSCDMCSTSGWVLITDDGGKELAIPCDMCSETQIQAA